MNCLPPPPKHFVAKGREKTPWDFNKSIFKKYNPDNDVSAHTFPLLNYLNHFINYNRNY